MRKLLQHLLLQATFVLATGAAFLFGQSIGRIHDIKSCKAIIDDTMAEAEATLRAKAAML